MLYRKPRVGQDINAYCGKCKDERTHTVAAMDGDTVKKVTCTMCKGTHNYKSKPVASAEKTPRTKAAGTARRSREAVPFTIDPKRPVKNYSMEAAFGAGDVISHPKFGLGAVETIMAPNKIEVRFQEGKKLLLHNMKNFRP